MDAPLEIPLIGGPSDGGVVRMSLATLRSIPFGMLERAIFDTLAAMEKQGGGGGTEGGAYAMHETPDGEDVLVWVDGGKPPSADSQPPELIRGAGQIWVTF